MAPGPVPWGPPHLAQVRHPGGGRAREGGAGAVSALRRAGAGAAGVHFLTKAKLTKDLLAAIFAHTDWTTVIDNDDGTPARQIADIPFARAVWQQAGLPVRVIAVRTLEQTSGKQVQLWDDLDYTLKVYLTNDFDSDGDWLAVPGEGFALVAVVDGVALSRRLVPPVN